MTDIQWNVFCNFRNEFKAQCLAWAQEADWLVPLQIEAAKLDGVPAYEVENPLVYNSALDEITKDDSITLIVIGDNPGKNEQLQINRRYLVGQAGKLGDRFFKTYPELNIDFRRNVIILNKTPIHSAKTKQLSFLCNKGGEKFTRLFNETQNWMAQATIKLHAGLTTGLWMVGYSELGKKGLFAEYARAFKEAHEKTNSMCAENQSQHPNRALQIFAEPLLFQHFSMNRFTIDLKNNYNVQFSLEENLYTLGLRHRNEILGW